ncbi:hypothetical protein HPP92_026531 [Vanilla planifolia]|uniref:Uncharacterized protein n=1 Tax=Vanilla planifolia TaxID=51239 RepID=A0A835U7I1_VANPL|nr:hypothetical protein HPP92_026759 [Vanilla planifolia]KAG0450850.1 hypothetical protein HPP92_026531 [Vanilla planifolia]
MEVVQLQSDWVCAVQAALQDMEGLFSLHEGDVVQAWIRDSQWKLCCWDLRAANDKAQYQWTCWINSVKVESTNDVEVEIQFSLWKKIDVKPYQHSALFDCFDNLF